VDFTSRPSRSTSISCFEIICDRVSCHFLGQLWLQTCFPPSSTQHLHNNNVQNSYTSLQNTEKYLHNTTHRPASVTKQPYFNEYMRFALGIKIPRHVADHLNLYSIENGWSYTNAPHTPSWRPHWQPYFSLYLNRDHKLKSTSEGSPVIFSLLLPHHAASWGCGWRNCLWIWRVAANILK